MKAFDTLFEKLPESQKSKLTEILTVNCFWVGRKTSKLLKFDPKIVSEINFKDLIDKMKEMNDFNDVKFMYFCGDKTALESDELPDNFIKSNIFYQIP